ncbi:regulatory protein RepA [uncultured Mediterranean phage uvMED]|nr:regulatory protein RepA [uncultured Mediterranean phage uvMED]
MTDLTEFYGEQGLVIDKNFAFTSTSKSNSDLISEMRSNGLLVDFLDTTGNLIRVPVSATATTRPDKANERSGYYAYNQLDNNFVCIYGNWRTSQEWKFTSYNPNEMSAEEKRLMQSKLEESQKRREEAKAKKQEEVSIYAKEKFASANEVTDHNYLNDKKVKSYGLKTINGNLLIPVHSITKSDNGILVNDIKSLQYIFPDGSKKFVGGGEIKGNVFLIGCEATEIPYLDTLILCEGYATGSSIFEATGLPVAVVFSANFCLTASVRLRKITAAKFIIALDNDTSGIGEKNANEVVNAVSNCVSRLPSITGDFNDLHLAKGLDQVKSELTESKFNIRQYAIRNLVEEPKPIEWLVDSFIPLGKPGIIAAVGGVGKSLSMIQLALGISTGGQWWGKTIMQKGSTVIFAAEDDLSEVHRRIASLDPLGLRFQSEYDVYVFPIPEQKEPMILLKEEGVTSQATELVEELKTIPNLQLVVFDPLQAFTTGNISSSNEVGQLWGSYCANISARLGVTTLTVHHLAKSALTNDSDDALSHRAEIRGASSITDSVRFAIAMWLADSDTCEKICLDQGIEFDRMAVVKASLVKSNSGNVDYKTKTLVRNGAVLEILDENKKSFEWD